MSTAMLRQTCTISRISRVPDGQGGHYAVEHVVAESVACKLDAPSAGGDDGPLTDLGQRGRSTVKRTLYVLSTVDVRRDDVVRVDTGEQVTVINVRRPGGRPFVLEEHREVDVEEHQHGR